MVNIFFYILRYDELGYKIGRVQQNYSVTYDTQYSQ